MRELFYRFIDTLFSDEVNDTICYSVIGLAGTFMLFQAVRFFFLIII